MPQGIASFAEVAVPIAVHGTFTYSIPPALRDEVRLGSRVEVPLGTKRTTGFVVALADRADSTAKLKPVTAVLDEDEPALIPEIIELCRWAADYYLAPLGEMLRVALPANMAARGRRELVLAGDDPSSGPSPSPSPSPSLRSGSGPPSPRTRGEGAPRDPSPREAGRGCRGAAGEGPSVLDSDLALLNELRKRPLLVTEALGAFSRSTIQRLRDAGLVAIRDQFRDAIGVRYDRFVRLESDGAALPPKQVLAVEQLRARGGEASVRALENASVSASTLATLARKGIVRIERRPRRHTLDAFLAGLDAASAGDIRHSLEQQQAIAAIKAALGTFAPFLIEGVTGSGKTEVYIEIMREVVRRGEQALLLVPEISLTPVFAARLKERFGDRIAVLHSGLSPSERYDQWWRARRGEVDVAIGARSALFTPFQHLGVIVVDEEGDGAYKQDETPRYNARDLAVVRAQLRSIPVILGSATPSLESRDNAARGKYTLLRMTHRVEARPLPEAEVIDLRKERGEKEDRGFVIFSAPLKETLRATFASGQQAIILINRRGYAPYLLCRDCGHDFRCRDCSVTMTVHRRAGLLICHYCGLRKAIPSKCPLCGGEVLQPIGFGTEKVEERFRREFPDVGVDVLDRDSTRKKGELVRILDRFRRQQTQALIGTQMLSKGHHFPSVTLTAVLNADSILGYPDFRSAEKTFYLLTQVAGRSGRGEQRGKVLIQTAFPTHYAIQHAMRHDYESFYEAEIEFRKTFHYPPVTSMIAVLFRGPNLTAVERAASESGRKLEEAIASIAGTRIQGPAPAPLARIKGVYRYQILLRSAHRVALRKAVEGVMVGRKWSGVDTTIDVDPINIL